MIGYLAASNYGTGSSGGGYWAVIVLLAAIAIGGGTWLFLRMRNRSAHRPQGPSPQPPSSG